MNGPISVYRKKRKLLKERRKQRERVELKMDLPGVSIADNSDSSMFSLHTINRAKVSPVHSGNPTGPVWREPVMLDLEP